MRNEWLSDIFSMCFIEVSVVLGNSVWQGHAPILKQVNQSLSSVQTVELHSQLM